MASRIKGITVEIGGDTSGLSVVGDKIQDVGDKAVSAYAETETAVSKVNAYFGEAGEAAEASAEVVKNVYGSGVGQSMDAVAEAVIMVKKNLGDARLSRGSQNGRPCCPRNDGLVIVNFSAHIDLVV